MQLLLLFAVSIALFCISGLEAVPIPVTKELRAKHAPHTLAAEEGKDLKSSSIEQTSLASNESTPTKAGLLRLAKDGSTMGASLNKGIGRMGHALSSVDNFHSALLDATLSLASQLKSVTSPGAARSDAKIPSVTDEEDHFSNPWADAIGSAIHDGGLATIAGGGRQKAQLQQDFDRLAGVPMRALHRDRHRIASNVAKADKRLRKGVPVEERLSSLLSKSALAEEAVTTVLKDSHKSKSRMFTSTSFTAPEKEATRLLRARLYPAHTNTVPTTSISDIALLDISELDSRLQAQWDSERLARTKPAEAPLISRRSLSSAPSSMATGVPKTSRNTKGAQTKTTVYNGNDAAAGSSSAASRRSFGAQAYRPINGDAYIPIFNPIRSYCGEGLLTLSDNDDSKMSFMCKDFNTAATTTTTTTPVPSTTGEPQPPAGVDILTGRVPFSVGAYKDNMTDAQRRTCVVAASDISCVCGSDAQRAQDGNGLQVCIMKSIWCDFTIVSPNATCIPASTTAATPKRIGEGCYVTSRTNPSYQMQVRAACSTTSLSNATFQSFGFSELTGNSEALLVIARWKGDTEYVLVPNNTADPFDATTDNGNTVTTDLVSGPYAALSTNVTLFGYVEATAANTVNLTAANDLFNDTNFNFYNQWYNFNKLSDDSASNTRSINHIDHGVLVKVFNGREDIQLDFNLNDIKTDDFFAGGRLYGEIGFEGAVISSSAAVLLLDITDPPAGTYREPSRSFSAALLAAIIFVIIVVGAGSVYWFRGWRETRRAEQDRKNAEQLGVNERVW